MAQTILYRWTEHEHRTGLREEPSFSFQITSLLNKYAHQNYDQRRHSGKPNDSYDDWMRAQNELAEQVIYQTGRA